MTIIRMSVWFVVIAAVVVWATQAYADPIYEAAEDGVRVTLHNSPCELKEVSNLKYKATWEEKGKIYQGCWGARTDIGQVMFYFDDGSVGLIPVNALQPVRGA